MTQTHFFSINPHCQIIILVFIYFLIRNPQLWKIQRPEDGLYYVYSHVSFEENFGHGSSGSRSVSNSLSHYLYRYNIIYRNGGEELLIMNSLTKCWDENKQFGEYSSYLGALFKLRRRDELFVKVQFGILNWFPGTETRKKISFFILTSVQYHQNWKLYCTDHIETKIVLDWLIDCFLNGVQYRNGRLVVPEDGLYYVYSHVSFEENFGHGSSGSRSVSNSLSHYLYCQIIILVFIYFLIRNPQLWKIQRS
jgi:hypothetical protein